MGKIDIKNAIIITACYDNLTWQTKTIDLWCRYAKNIDAELVIIDKSDIDKYNIIFPYGDKTYSKFAAYKFCAESRYDKVMFADIDTVVNPHYYDVFKYSSDFMMKSYQPDPSLYTSIQKRMVEIAEKIYHPPSFFFCSTSVFMCIPQVCRDFISFCDREHFFPSNKNKDSLEEMFTIKNEKYWVTDQWVWDVYFTMDGSYIPDPIQWSYALYPNRSDFVTDLWYSKTSLTSNFNEVVEKECSLHRDRNND